MSKRKKPLKKQPLNINKMRQTFGLKPLSDGYEDIIPKEQSRNNQKY